MLLRSRRRRRRRLVLFVRISSFNAHGCQLGRWSATAYVSACVCAYVRACVRTMMLVYYVLERSRRLRRRRCRLLAVLAVCVPLGACALLR